MTLSIPEAVDKIQSLKLNVEHHDNGIRITTSKGERLHRGYKSNIISAVEAAIQTIGEGEIRSKESIASRLFDLLSSGRIYFTVRLGPIDGVTQKVYDIYDADSNSIIVNGSRSLKQATLEAEAIINSPVNGKVK